jgi:hypothetical protein
MASAVVYKWVDAQGKLQYGDRPPDGVHAEVVEILGAHAAHVGSARSDSPQSSAPTRPATASNYTMQGAPGSQDDATKQQVAADVAQVKDKQCADAQARYKQLIEGRRLFKAGENGERQYLTAEEIDSERVNAKRDIDTTCDGPT